MDMINKMKNEPGPLKKTKISNKRIKRRQEELKNEKMLEISNCLSGPGTTGFLNNMEKSLCSSMQQGFHQVRHRSKQF